MAYEAKLKTEDMTVEAFLDAVEPPQRQAEARRLVEIFAEVTGYEPKVFSHGMIGFGRYSYTYDTGFSGTAFATGFSPRKAELSLYVLSGHKDQPALLARLGKHRAGKACLYIKSLAAADEGVLRQLITAGLDDLKSHWPVTPV